jgi:hypothetical protein
LTACAAPATEAPVGAPPGPPREILPLKTLRLYETGVGYFERSGTLGAHMSTTLPVPPGQLDDALASLVVLKSGSGGMVSGVSFASSVTRAAARSRAGLPADPASPVAFVDLLGSMRGEKVSIVTSTASGASGASSGDIAGRVVEVGMETDEAAQRALSQQKDAPHDHAPQRLVVTVLTDGGALTRVPAETIVRIRPADPAFATRLDEALDATGTRSTRNARGLKLLGSVEGPVTFGYVTETPIWRASYRLVVEPRADGSSARAASLQGWALLHNDTDENWHDVHLELVNGEPDSFLFPLAAPRYARRALVHPDNPLSTLPQLQDMTADAMWGDHIGDDVALDGIGGTGQGFGSGHGRLSGGHSASSSTARGDADGATGRSSLLDVGNLADLAPATGVEQGALFVYAIPAGFSLEGHASALVPFVERSVSAEPVTYFSAPDAGGRAAILFVNSTGQTLPTGTLTVFGAGGFTGETSLDRLKPGERRFLRIGNDLDGEVRQTKTESREESKRLTLEGGSLHEHFLRTSTKTWEVENRGSGARSFYVVLDAERNAKVTGADRVDFDEAGEKPVVVLDVKAKEKKARTLTVIEGLSRTITIDHLTERGVRALLAKSTIPSAELAALQQALPEIRALEAAHAAVDGQAHTTKVAEAALERLRLDLKALGGGSGAGGAGTPAPLVKRLVDAEDRVEAAQRAREAAEKALGDRRDAVRAALAPLILAQGR